MNEEKGAILTNTGQTSDADAPNQAKLAGDVKMIAEELVKTNKSDE